MSVPTLERFKPVGRYILLKPRQAASISEGGIIIPECARGGLTQGTIVAKGPLVSEEYAIGDQILFGQHTESPLEIDGEKFLLLDDVNVWMHGKPDPTPTDFGVGDSDSASVI